MHIEKYHYLVQLFAVSALKYALQRNKQTNEQTMPKSTSVSVIVCVCMYCCIAWCWPLFYFYCQFVNSMKQLCTTYNSLQRQNAHIFCWPKVVVFFFWLFLCLNFFALNNLLQDISDQKNAANSESVDEVGELPIQKPTTNAKWKLSTGKCKVG